MIHPGMRVAAAAAGGGATAGKAGPEGGALHVLVAQLLALIDREADVATFVDILAAALRRSSPAKVCRFTVPGVWLALNSSGS
jgi:hypothetical protein